MIRVDTDRTEKNFMIFLNWIFNWNRIQKYLNQRLCKVFNFVSTQVKRTVIFLDSTIYFRMHHLNYLCMINAYACFYQLSCFFFWKISFLLTFFFGLFLLYGNPEWFKKIFSLKIKSEILKFKGGIQLFKKIKLGYFRKVFVYT